MSDRPWPLNLISGPSEDATPRDGAFSYSGEWHAFFIGAGVGFAAVMPSARLREFVFRVVGFDGTGLSRTAAVREAKDESWYALGGVVVGAMLGLACLVGLLYSAGAALL